MSCLSTQLILRLLLGLKRDFSFLFFSYGASDTQNYFPFFSYYLALPLVSYNLR